MKLAGWLLLIMGWICYFTNFFLPHNQPILYVLALTCFISSYFIYSHAILRKYK